MLLILFCVWRWAGLLCAGVWRWPGPGCYHHHWPGIRAQVRFSLVISKALEREKYLLLNLFVSILGPLHGFVTKRPGAASYTIPWAVFRIRRILKENLTRDFRLQVFFMIQFSPGPYVPYGNKYTIGAIANFCLFFCRDPDPKFCENVPTRR